MNDIKLVEWVGFDDVYLDGDCRYLKDPNKYEDFDNIKDSYIHNKAREIVKETIKRDNLWFDGCEHQSRAIPIFEVNGKKYCYMCSFRYWGGIMAEAHNELLGKQEYDYMDFYMGCSNDKCHKLPK